MPSRLVPAGPTSFVMAGSGVLGGTLSLCHSSSRSLPADPAPLRAALIIASLVESCCTGFGLANSAEATCVMRSRNSFEWQLTVRKLQPLHVRSVGPVSCGLFGLSLAHGFPLVDEWCPLALNCGNSHRSVRAGGVTPLRFALPAGGTICCR